MATNETSIIISAVDKTGDAIRSVTSNLGGLSAQADSLKGALSGIAAAAGVSAFAAMIKGSIDAAAAMHDLAQQTGASVEALSAMKPVAELSETSLDTVATAMQKMAKVMPEMSDKSKDASAALKAIGLEGKEIARMNTDEAFRAIAKGMSNVENSAGKTAVAMALFGKSGAQLIPFLNDLGTAGELQAKITAEQAAMADEFGDNLTKLKQSGAAWKTEVAMGMVPALSDLSNSMVTVLSGTGGLRDEVRKMSADHTIEEWTRSGISALLELANAMDGVGRVFKQFQISSAAVINDVVTGAKITKAFVVTGGLTEAGRKEIDEILAQRKEILRLANEDTDTNLTKGLFGDRLRGEMERTRQLRVQAASLSSSSAPLGGVAPGSLRKVDFQGGEKQAAATTITDYERLTKAINDKIAVQELELIADGNVTDGEKERIKFLVQLRDGTISMTAAEKMRSIALLNSLVTREKELALKKEIEKHDQAALNRQADAIDADQKAAQSIMDETTALRDQTKELGLTAMQLLELRQARVDDEIARQQSRLSIAEDIDKYSAQADAIRETIAALEDRKAALSENTFRQMAVDDEKKIAEARKKGWEDTDQMAREIFSSWATEGGNAAQKIGDTLKSALLSAIYEATLRPLVFQMYISTAGALGGLTGTSTGANSLSGAGNLLSTGNSVYNLASGGGIAGGFLSGMASAGSEAALGAAFVGPSATLAGGSVGAGASVGSMFGASAGTLAAALPFVGGALAIGSILGLFGGKAPPSSQGNTNSQYKDGVYSVLSQDRGTGDKYNANLAASSAAIGKSYSETVGALFKTMGKSLDLEFSNNLHTRGDGKQYSGFTGTLNGVTMGPRTWTYGKVSSEEAYKQAVEHVMSYGILAAIKASDFSDTFKHMFDGLSGSAQILPMAQGMATLTARATELNDVWGITADQAGLAAKATATSNDQLVSTVTAMATFATAQRTQGEILAETRDSLLTSFESLVGSDFPTTLAAYDAAMKGVDKTADAGIETFGKLFAMRSDFADFSAAIDTLKNSAQSSVFDLRTPQGQLDVQQAALETAAKAAGVAIPKTAAELVKLADSIDYTSAAGINFAASLPSLVTAFKNAQTAFKNAQPDLSSFYSKLTTIGGMRSKLFDDIFDAQLSGMDSSGKIAALKEKEKGLWADLQGGDLKAASSLQETILKRIDLESQAKLDATNTQLTAAESLLESMKSVAEYATSLRSDMLSLQAGDLSPLSFKDQLAAAQTLYSETLAKAKTGDTTAQSSLSGVRSSYLSEAQGYYGASTDYANLFNSVMGDMSGMASGAPSQTAIESQQIIVDRLTTATNSQVDLSKEQVEALKKIDAILATQQSNTEAQLVQNGAAYSDILTVLREIDKRLQSVESTNRQAAVA